MANVLRLFSLSSGLLKFSQRSFLSPHLSVRLQSVPKHSFSSSVSSCLAISQALFKSIRLPFLLVPLGLFSRGCSSSIIAHCRSKGSSRVSLLRTRHLSNERGLGSTSFDWLSFWNILAPDILILLLAAMSAVVVAFLNVRIPLTLGELINVISGMTTGKQAGQYLSELVRPGLSLAGLYALQSLFTFGYISLLSIVGERCALRLRTQLFQSLLEQDIAFFDTHKTGELVNRLSGDVQDFKSSFKMVVGQGLKSITQTAGCVISLFIISPKMTILVGVVVPAMIGVGTVLGRILRGWSYEAQEQVSMATAVADEALSNIRTVRAFAMEDKELSLYERELVQASWFNQRLGFGIAGFQGLTNLAINGMVLIVLSHGGLLLASNQITPGSLMSFLVATQTIQRSLGQLSILFGQVVKGMTAGSRVFEYIDMPHSIPVSGGAVIPADKLVGEVEFRNVSFSYPSRSEQKVLDDFNISLSAGKVIALCGLSGAGKSTVAVLLERFYDPEFGGIYIDGRDLRSLDPQWVRGSLIGYINQEPILFATSIIENIRYGKPSATDHEVYEAAKLANADEFISKFPAGYNTVVGERGVTLSGGQKQRVAIARALLKDPQVLILDEATSALDAHSEKLVQEALDRVSKGRTVLVIAHRLSTIQDADTIAVVHQGKIRETGSHSSLLRQKGLYYELVRRQTDILTSKE